MKKLSTLSFLAISLLSIEGSAFADNPLIATINVTNNLSPDTVYKNTTSYTLISPAALGQPPSNNPAVNDGFPNDYPIQALCPSQNPQPAKAFYPYSESATPLYFYSGDAPPTNQCGFNFSVKVTMTNNTPTESMPLFITYVSYPSYDPEQPQLYVEGVNQKMDNPLGQFLNLHIECSNGLVESVGDINSSSQPIFSCPLDVSGKNPLTMSVNASWSS